jgi:hypothetical protein
MVNQAFQSRRSPHERTGYRQLMPIDEDPLTAIRQDATEPAGQNLDPNHFPRDGSSDSRR